MPPSGSYPKVPQAKITSLDIVSLDGGLDQRGEANIRANSFSKGRNVMVDPQGLATFRLAQKRWLPDVVGTAGQVFPALYGGVIKYITPDNGKIKWCLENATSWTDCGGDNTVTTANTTTTFMRVLDKVLILNGEDRLGYVDLTTMNVVHFSIVADPTLAPTGTAIGIVGTSYKVYYAIWYSGLVGKTASSPILTQQVSKIREQWASDGSQGVTITDPNTRPAGAVAWNVGLATAPAGGTIQLSDIVPLALGLDINSNTFTDNGKIVQPTNAGTAPTANSTQGPKAKYGVEIEGRPFLYGIKDDPYAVLIGGDDVNALDFNEGNGGYRLVLNQGTNYYPQSVFGFRNGQGVPSTTVLFSNSEGLSKQSIIEQNTISLGTFSGTVWGSTEQNYGAAGVSSPYAVVNYKGMMVFPTTDGVLKLDTQASLQNVLLPERISDPVIDDISSIRTDLLNKIVGTAWANKVMFAMPTGGFAYNNKIVIYDVTRKGNECWYTFDIRAQWIGTISPPGFPGFVYIAQDNHFFRLDKSYAALDELANGLTQSFPMEMTTALIGTNTAHNGYFAVVQGVFYLKDWVGSVTCTVRWRDFQSGELKSKSRTFTNGSYQQSSVGGWSSPGNLFNQLIKTKVLRWGDSDKMTDSVAAQKTSKRKVIPMNGVLTNELQATVAINLDNSAVVVRSISFEGQPLGVSPDVR
jgi:hypothetical protein